MPIPKFVYIESEPLTAGIVDEHGEPFPASEAPTWKNEVLGTFPADTIPKLDPPRRTGRTTRGLLECLRLASEESKNVYFFAATNSSGFNHYCAGIIQDSAYAHLLKRLHRSYGDSRLTYEVYGMRGGGRVTLQNVTKATKMLSDDNLRGQGLSDFVIVLDHTVRENEPQLAEVLLNWQPY